VEFPAAAYLNQVNVTEADVRAYYDANPARFAKPAAAADKAPAPSNPAADYAQVRPQVEAALRLDRAQRLAGKAASDFVVALFEKKPAFGSNELQQILQQNNLAPKDLPPFAEGQTPAVLGGDPQISQEAFRLNKDRYFSDALPTPTGSVILFWKDLLPSRKPMLSEVRARVASDFVEDQKRRLFVEAGKKLRTQIAERMKAGDSFEKAVATSSEAAGIKAEVKMHPAFTLRQQPQDLDYSIFNILDQLNKGEVSEMVRTQDKGLLVYAADKKLPDVSETNPEFQATRMQIAQATGARTGSEYIGELVQRELAKANPAAE
jgi:peptidyl-prolyl cis-trans isomerase D